MAKSTGTQKPDYTRASQLRLDDRPDVYTFGFESQKSKVGAGASVAAHMALIAIVVAIIQFAPKVLPPEITEQLKIDMIAFLPIPGPGGGGGGGGDPKPEPPRKAEVAQKKDPISVPVQKAPDPTPEQPKEPPPPEPLVPFVPMAASEVTLPGVVPPSGHTTS